MDVTELLARIAAERGEPADDERDGGPQTGVTELIARISAERGGAERGGAERGDQHEVRPDRARRPVAARPDPEDLSYDDWLYGGDRLYGDAQQSGDPRYAGAGYDGASYDGAGYDLGRYDAAEYDPAQYDSAHYDSAHYDSAQYEGDDDGYDDETRYVEPHYGEQSDAQLYDHKQHSPEQTDVSELIARIAAERGDPFEDTAAHRLQLIADARRSRRRRLAPVIAGVATVLVAGTVALTLRTHTDTQAGPTLDAALVGSSSASSAPAPPTSTTVQTYDATVPQITEPRNPDPQPAAKATTPKSAVAAAPKPAAADDGVQAAVKQGWTLVDRDEFTGGLSPKWTKYDGPGNAGKGTRTPDAITVENGAAVIRGDADGNTGGMSWKDDRDTGRWEMRAKFPKGDAQYHPVLLLWPDNGGSDDGEIDFAETTSAASSVSFFLHHGDGDQESAKKQIDLTQWHNYAVEVTADRVTGYIDGQKWFESTDRDTLPQGPVHPVIQLDWFPKGDSPEPSELLVDWMRIYQ